MPAPAAQRSSFECLARGFSSLRANLPLVGMVWLQQLLVTALTALGLLVPVLVVGWDRFRGLGEAWPSSPERVFEDLLAAIGPLALPLAAALLATSLVWLVAFLVFSWFQGGLYGVLMAAERQAPPGRGHGWRVFRTYRLADFAGWGRLYLWRYFWFWNLYWVVVTVWLLLVLVLAVGTVAGGRTWGGAAGFGIGCGGALPLFFLLVVVALWGWLTAPDLAREGTSVRRSARKALEVLGRRPGAVLLLALVFLATVLVVAGVFLPFSWAIARFAAPGAPAYLVGQGVLQLVQWLVTGLVTVAFAGAVAALMWSAERR